MLIELLLLVSGLALLWLGAEVLVKYASLLARSFGISPLIIGLTVVSIGTSVPELVVSAMATLQGNVGISIGNIVGSNIANIGLILGVGALIFPLQIKKSWVLKEVPLMLLVTAAFTVFAYSGKSITLFEGVILLGFLVLFLVYIARFTLQEMSEFRELAAENGTSQMPWPRKLGYAVLAGVGIAVLIGGSKLAVRSGAALAEYWGVSDTVIGLTLIAIGTSLPELATTIVSAARKAIDLAVGNIIGSNIFNLALIGGFTALIRPIPTGGESPLLDIEIPLLILVSVILWPLMVVRWSIRRAEGLLLLTIYCLFIYLTV